MASRKHGTLIAAAVSSVTIDASGEPIVLFNHGTGATDEIYYASGTAAPTDPTVQGDDLRVCPAGSRRVITTPRSGAIIVKLISTGTPRYSLERVSEDERRRGGA